MPEPVGPNNAIAALPVLKWEGLEAPPYDDVSFGWSHSQAVRRFPYIDSAGHDWTGRDPRSTTANLFFLNSLRVDAFPGLWNLWRTKLDDGSIGRLEHPVLGEFDARITKVDGAFNAKSRAGLVVSVSWSESLRDPNQAQKFKALTVSLKKSAAAAQAAATAKGIDYPTGLRTNSLADLAAAIDGALFSATLSAGGYITQAQGIVGGMIDTVKRVDDHAVYAVHDNLVQLYNGLLDLADRAGADFARSTSRTSYPFPTTLDVAAADLGNSLSELMGLNLSLVRSPIIAPGVSVTYYS